MKTTGQVWIPLQSFSVILGSSWNDPWDPQEAPYSPESSAEIGRSGFAKLRVRESSRPCHSNPFPLGVPSPFQPLCFAEGEGLTDSTFLHNSLGGVAAVPLANILALPSVAHTASCISCLPGHVTESWPVERKRRRCPLRPGPWNLQRNPSLFPNHPFQNTSLRHIFSS